MDGVQDGVAQVPARPVGGQCEQPLSGTGVLRDFDVELWLEKGEWFADGFGILRMEFILIPFFKR